jgi:hypothetical protein
MKKDKTKRNEQNIVKSENRTLQGPNDWECRLTMESSSPDLVVTLSLN